jgi:LysR family transcriptional regulator, cyn operon transcriptional activator
MKLSQLQTFVTVADNGGFARATARLNLTQSAASRQISALESELGVPLFDRVGRRVQLTSEGEDLLRQSRRLVSDVEALGERARALKTGERGLLRVGATPQVIEVLIAGFLKRHWSRYPNIEVQLIEDGGAQLPSRLERGDVHVAVMPESNLGFHSRPLYPMHLCAVLPEGHRFSRHAILEVRELAGESLLLLDRRFAALAWFEVACHTAHIRPRARLHSASPHTIIALVKSGYGIAVIPSQMLIAQGGICTVPLVHKKTSIGRWAVIAWDPERFLAAYAKQFIEKLAASVRSVYPGDAITRNAPPLPRPKGLVN